MRVLVTGGSGVVGRSAVTALLARGHTVRLLSRSAATEADAWPSGVEPWSGDLSSPASVRGSATGCAAVIHLVAIVEEIPPERTFQRINVEGTRTMMLEAQRASCERFVFVSSLGAESGASDYHRSKREAERVVAGFIGDWIIIRPGAVYGPGDEHMSVLLRMVRTLPITPVLGDGDQPFQPVWHEDLAKALALSVDWPGIERRILEVAGAETTSQTKLIERMRRLTRRTVVNVPLPAKLATTGVDLLEKAGIALPIAKSQLQMLQEHNIIGSGRPNGLVDVFGVTPTPLDVGLERLAAEQPERLPSEGSGELRKKSFVVAITPSRYSADEL